MLGWGTDEGLIIKILSHRNSAQPSSSGEYETSGSTAASASGLSAIMAAKSMEFSYQKLAKATNNFSSDNKIGQGGFGAVYFAELRGQKAAIKNMDVQASTEFLSELKVLTHVHHLNLILRRGISFLVYEYIENGNLSQYLHGTGREPLAWSTRVQIALDSARGLEYIHKHTVPIYIHRDVKPANILIYKDFHGKNKLSMKMALLRTLREQHWWSLSDLSLVTTTSSSKLGRESFIDLNFPALAEEDDASQFEDSAISDAEFVNPTK
ncbi:hypothetical protein HN51_069747, partial [Arachis hypogaea]